MMSDIGKLLGHRDDDPQINIHTVHCSQPDDSKFLHPVQDLVSNLVVEDMRRLAEGHGEPIQTKYVQDFLRARGMDPDKAGTFSEKMRRRIHNEMVRHMDRLIAEREGQNPWAERPSVDVIDAAVRARSAVFERLKPWSQGPLRLERPQGSSFHHLLEYNERTTNGTFARSVREKPESFEPQLFVVTHDWHRAMQGTGDFLGGEWRMPFELCCFEFRISGVRVLVLSEDVEHQKIFNCVYGLDDHWVGDDQEYAVQGEKVVVNRTRMTPDTGDTVFPMPRVNAMVIEQIRAACIVIDSPQEIAELETVVAPERLNRKRVQAGRPVVRDHMVVRLHRRIAARASERADDPTPTGRRMPFHWRRGHHRYFDNLRGQEQNNTMDTGWASRTWINWMMVGDPDLSYVEREYRL